MRRVAILLTLLVCCSCIFAQQKKTKKLQEKVVEITHTEVFGHDVSQTQAESQVLEQAKIKAIADNFGTTVSMSNRTSITNINGQSNTSFVSLGASDVLGEWIETIGTPKWNRVEEGNLTAYTVTMRGRIREWNKSSVDIDVMLLCNGVDTLTNKLRMGTYYHGDSAYVYFKSPVEGYVAIYITDELSDNKIAQRLLPYPRQGGQAYHVLADEDYYFFSKNKAPSKDRRFVVTERMGCYGQFDINKVYVIFSPTPFTKANDTNVSSDMPNQLPLDDFHKWLTSHRRRDTDMVVKPFIIEIRKP